MSLCSYGRVRELPSHGARAMDFAAFLSSLCGGGPLEAWLSQARILRLRLSPIRIGVSLYPYLGGNRYGSGYYFEAYPFMVLTVISATTTWLAAWRTGPRQAAVVRACFRLSLSLLFSMSLAILVSGAESSAQTIRIFGNAVPNDPIGSGNAVTLGVKFWGSQSGTISAIRLYRGASSPFG
jgi:hypothetical protein